MEGRRVHLVVRQAREQAALRGLVAAQTHRLPVALEHERAVVEERAHTGEVGFERRLAHVQPLGHREHVDPIRVVEERTDERVQAVTRGRFAALARAQRLTRARPGPVSGRSGLDRVGAGRP